MSSHVDFSFRVKEKGGSSGGKLLSRKVPAFDWEKFKNTPNAQAFVEKAYFAAIKKIMREIEEHKNGSVASDLESTETVIARTLHFTQDEIKDWINTRDWSKASQVPNIAEVLPVIKKYLPELALRRNHFSPKDSEKLAYKIIAAVADNPDPIAEFLFTSLTTLRVDDTVLADLS